jgi:hypothetical protein
MSQTSRPEATARGARTTPFGRTQHVHAGANTVQLLELRLGWVLEQDAVELWDAQR